MSDSTSKIGVVERIKGEYCVKSPNNPNWSGGCYSTKGEAEKRLSEVEYFKSKGASMSYYSYNHTAAKKKPKASPKPKVSQEPDEEEIEDSRTDGAKRSEVEIAIEAINTALDAVHDCAPNGKDFRDGDEYNSKAYSKAVDAHNERVNALHDILSDLNELMKNVKED